MTSIDTRAFRQALGQFPTGVCVVTCQPGDQPVGMTMSSFNALSLDPPLVLFSIDKRAKGLPLWEKAEGYAIHVLAEHQRDVSDHFARAQHDKWDGLQHDRGYAGAPLLKDTAALFECAAFARHDAGDHVLFIAQVERFDINRERRPLVFAQGGYAALRA